MRAATPRTLVTAGLLLVACTACHTRSVTAQEKHPIARLLEAGFGDQPSSLDDAQRVCESARTALKDGRVDYAMALVMLRHRKYDDARRLLQAAVAKDRANLPAWRALVWLDMFTGRHDSSLKQMNALAWLYPEGKARAEVQQPLCDSARWMGQLLGFLEGPGKEAVAAETVAAHRKAISDELTGQWRQAFDAGRQQVLGQYSQLRGELDAALKKALAEEQQQKAEGLKSLEQDRARIAGELSNLQRQAYAAKNASAQVVSNIDLSLRPLVQKKRDLLDRAAPYRRRIVDLQRDLVRAQAAARTKQGNPDLAQAEARRLQNELDRESALLLPIDNELRRVQARGNSLTLKRAAAVASCNNTLNAIDRQRRKLERARVALDKKERFLKQPATGRTPETSSLSNRVVALTTYLPFPLEEARRRLLESLRE